MKYLNLIVVLVFGFLSVSGCESIEEAENIAKAQECLDGISQSAPEEALTCLDSVKDYTSQQANILKCSIYHTAGGLTETKLVKAYQAYVNDSVTNKEAALMAALSLDKSDLTVGLQRAQTADVFCQDTGISSIQYLSSVIVAGTLINTTIASVNGSAIDITNPSTVDAALDAFMAQCAPSGATGNVNCDDNLQALGTVVATLSTSYCSNEESADKDVCEDINDAMAAAGNNAADLGQAVLCYMNGKTFNPTTHYCN